MAKQWRGDFLTDGDREYIAWGRIFMLGVHYAVALTFLNPVSREIFAPVKKSPLAKGAIFSRGRKSHVTPDLEM